VGKAWREEEESAEVAVAASAAGDVRGEEGSRWRTSVLNLRSALGCAARALAVGILSARLGYGAPSACVRASVSGAVRGESRGVPECGRRVCV
jgi:hypothetical protein